MTTPATTTATTPVHPPETLEGWYALHQIFTVDRSALRTAVNEPALRADAVAALAELARPADGGWSAPVTLVGPGDLMLVHFRPTLDGLAAARARLARAALFDHLRPLYSFLSVAEAGLYHATAKLAKEALARGGKVGDDAYRERLTQLAKAELESDHVKKRLYPTPPPDMPYVCFYPMSKRRAEGQNWYEQSLEERSRMMYEHGLTGRRYAGRVFQVITGAMGLDAWEWGVTLFARDPLEFKKLVSEMRFDEASRKYAEFGAFYVGKTVGAEEAVGAIL